MAKVTFCDQCNTSEGDIVTYQLEDSEFDLCAECAIKAGFCISCGGFFGGTEEFLHSGFRGCCADCRAELELEDGYEPDDFEY